MEGVVAIGIGMLVLAILTGVALLLARLDSQGGEFSPSGAVDYRVSKVHVMRNVASEIVDSIDSDLPETRIALYPEDPDDVLTIIMEIEQFRYLRKKRTLWDWQGTHTEREIRQRWARQPRAVREWQGIEFVVPIAVKTAFSIAPSLRAVRMWIGDENGDRAMTVCRVSVEATPDGNYDWRYDRRAKGYLAPVTPHADRRPRLAAVGLAEDPYDFEQQVAQMLRGWGLSVEVTGGPGDEGVDIMAYDSTPITGGKYLVQCKRYSPGKKVGVAAVRELYGTMQEKQVTKGVLVTSSAFTTGALRFAEDKSIDLIDGTQLSELLAKTAPDEYTEEDDASDADSEEDEEFTTPLHEAADAGEPDQVERLLRLGADVNARDYYERTPLHRAAAAVPVPERLVVLRMLLSNGADVNAKRYGETPLHVNMATPRREDITLLIDAGADINAPTSLHNETPLHCAVQHAVSSLRILGGTIYTIMDGSFGEYSTEEVFKPVIALLVRRGADTTAKDRNGKTPYDIALEGGLSEEILTLLRPRPRRAR